MIGKSAFYIDGGAIIESKIVASYLVNDKVWYKLESGAEFNRDNICFSIKCVVDKLVREFREAEIAKNRAKVA
jgi:hypothetical protein